MFLEDLDFQKGPMTDIETTIITIILSMFLLLYHYHHHRYPYHHFSIII